MFGLIVNGTWNTEQWNSWRKKTSTTLKILKCITRENASLNKHTGNHPKISNTFLSVVGQRHLCQYRWEIRCEDSCFFCHSWPGISKVMKYSLHSWPWQSIVESILKLVTQRHLWTCVKWMQNEHVSSSTCLPLNHQHVCH